MNENRVTQIVDEEIEDFKEIEPRSKEEIADELFEKLKDALLQEDRLIKKFYGFLDGYTEFDYDEMGLDFDEAEDLLRKANKIKDKIVLSLQEKLDISFYDISIETLHMMIIAHTKYEDEIFKIIIEVAQDSFDLEVI